MFAFLRPAANVSLLLFIVTALLGTGMTLTVRKILEPWRNARIAISSFAASLLAVPILALAITWAIPLDHALRTGLVLLSLSAGSEALPKIAEMMKGDARYAVGLMGIQITITVIFVPFILAVFVPGVNIHRSVLVMKLVVLVLVPLAVGLFLNARYESAAKRMQLVLHKVSTILLMVVFALYIAANFEILSSICRLDTVLVAVIYSALAFVAGYLFGGPDKEGRITLGVGSLLRSGSIEMVFASQAFTDPKVITMIMLVVVSWLVVLPAMVVTFGWIAAPSFCQGSQSLSQGLSRVTSQNGRPGRK